MIEQRGREPWGSDGGARTPLRVLVVEDSADDAALVLRELERGGYETRHERVETPEAMRQALQAGRWDVITADHAMPRFSAPAALSVLQEEGLVDLPFIIVSGEIGEDAAVAAMRAGAHDYVMKDNLKRLCPAVKRELGEAEKRREHRRSNAALRESEERFRTFFERSTEGIWRLELEEPIPTGSPEESQIQHLYRHAYLAECNDAMSRMYGYSTATDLANARLGDLLPSRVPENVEYLRAFISSGYKMTGTTSRVDQQGSTQHFSSNLVGIVEGGSLRRVWGTQRDITEHKRTEEELARSRYLFENIAEATPEVLYIFDLQKGRNVYTNRRIEQILGYAPEQLAMFGGRLDEELLHPDDKTRALSGRARINSLGDGEVLEQDVRVRHVDGHYRWLRARSIVFSRTEDGRACQILGLAQDITGRKRMEEALQRRDAILEAIRFAAEQFLRSEASWEESVREVLERLGESMNVCRVYVFENYLDDDGEVWGTQRHEWVAPGISTQMKNPLMEAIPYRAAGYGRWVELLSRGEPVHGHTREFPREEQPELQAQDIVSILIVPIFVEGEWWGQIGFDECFDEREWTQIEIDALRSAADTLGASIQRRQAEKELRESHTLLRNVIEGTTEPIFIKDTRGRYLLVNSSAAGIIGPPVEEILDKDDTEFFPPDVARTIMETDRRILDTEEALTLEEAVPVGDGTRTFLSTKSILRDHQGRAAGIVGVATDITERKRTEEQVREIKEAERRRISAELHDDVLQDLIYGLQEAKLARVADRVDRQGLKPDLEESLQTICEALQRAVEGLRAGIFELRLEGILERSVVSSVETLVELNRRMSRKQYEIHLSIDDGFLEHIQDGRSLVRILQEALNNARRHSGAGNIRVNLRMKENEVCAEVTDDGRGFDVGSVPGGVGTSTMRQRAEKLGGKLEIESQPGAGTTVRFRGSAERLAQANSHGR